MISVDAYMLIVAGVLLLFGIVVLVLGMGQKREDEAAERHDIAAE